jgi:DNA/RNA endonuclease G (NUC1)
MMPRTARKLVLPLLLLTAAPLAHVRAAAQAAPAPASLAIRGDVNGDGQVTVLDALAVLSYAVGRPLPDDYQLMPNADANGDGQVTALDALVIAGYALGRDVSRFPVGRPIQGARTDAVTCTADVRLRSVTCRTPRAAAPEGTHAVILGGQNVYVKLTSTGTAFDGGTRIFSTNVRVTNLIPQALGVDSAGGVDATGIRAFFHQLAPASVTVPNADGTGIFLSTDQPYFQYAGGLAKGDSTAAKTWQWHLPVGVESFTFTVYVSAPVQKPNGWVDVYPSNATLATAGQTVALSDSVRNVVGNTVTGAAVAWSSSNPAVATVDPATGVVTAVGGGSATITAQTSGPTRVGTATIVVGVPATLVKTGDGQTASVDGSVPTAPSVTVKDAGNAPVAGYPVVFRVATGGGKVNGDSVATVNSDSAGVARLTSWTMGSAAGQNTITATAGTASATFQATALDLVVNELMANPAGVTDADAEYLELWNRGPTPVNLNGFQVQDNSPSRETIGSDVIVPANGFVVFGHTTNTSLNGGITVDYISSSVGLANAADRFRIWAPGGALLDSVAYTSVSALSGVARERRVGVPKSPDVDGPGWQNPSTIYDAANGNRGTPHAANSPYVAPGAPVSVTVSPAFVMIHPGDSLQYTGQAKDASGNIATTVFTWSTDNAAVATVSSTGMVHAVADGEVNIVATSDNSVQGSVALQVFTESASAIYRNHLEFGKPLDADPATDTIVTRTQYVLSYSAARGGPNWVSWDLNRTQYGYVPRCDCFSPDSTTDIPAGVYRVNTNDYTGSGYTRGHMVRSEDRTLTAEDNRVTYKMTNMLPQTSELNAGPWGELEFWEESQAKYHGKELYVIAGGIYPASPLTLNNAGKVQIPSYTWKIVVVLSYAQGLADVHSAADLQVIAVKMPNITGIASHHWQEYEVTVDQLEQETGYDFLSLLPDDVEAIVENGGVAPVLTPTTIGIVTQPSDSAVSGSPLSRQPVVRILDQHGDTLAQAGVPVTAAIASGGGTLDGTVTVNTDAAGVATFTDLGISGAAGDRTLSFSSGSLAGATSTVVHVSGAAAVPSQLGMVTQPSASAQSGVAFTQQPVVQIEDGAGSPAAQAGVPVTAAIASGGGTLGGTVTVNTDASGVATFTDLSITGTAGPRTLSFTAPGLSSATSDTIALTVPDPASTSAQIAAVRAATDGALSLPIEQALVTYTKPLIGSDAAGFFVQSERAGPAVFVAVDPTTLGGGIAAGDRVTFTATNKATLNSQVQVTTLTGFSVQSHGNDVASLVVPVDTVVNLPGAIGTYESRYVSITGTLAATPASAGTGFVSAQINTTGTPNNNLLRFRVPTTLSSQYELAAGCVLSATAPMWRFTTQAQPSAWAQADLTSVTCPAPKVASATVSSAISATVTFDRTIDPATVAANGSQFTFNNGLAATAASVSGKTVVLTTSTQTAGTSYTVTVAGTVKDTQGRGVDPAANTGTFSGYFQSAVLRITEIAPNITGSKDLVEFQVLQGGSTKNMTLVQDASTVLATLPDVQVATGDIIVLHLTPGATEGPASETTSKSQYAAATYTQNVDAAWDFNGGTTGITYSGRTLRIKDASGVTQDGVAATTASPPASYPTQLQALQAEGQWSPADCGGALCTTTSTPTAAQVSADWIGVTSTKTTTFRRISATDTNSRNDWAVGAGSIGTANP